MAVKINTEIVLDEAGRLASSICQLEDISDDIRRQRSLLDYKIRAQNNIDGRLAETASQVTEIKDKLQRLQSFMVYAATAYAGAENRLAQIYMNSGIGNAQTHLRSITDQEIKAQADSENAKKFKDTSDNLDDTKTGIELITNPKIDKVATDFLFKHLKMPNFRVDGDKLKVLDSDYNVGAKGFARWYNIGNLDKIGSGSYEAVSKL